MKHALLIAILATAILAGWNLSGRRLARERSDIASVQADREKKIERLRVEKARLTTELATHRPTLPQPSASPPASSPTQMRREASVQLAKLIANKTWTLSVGGGTVLENANVLIPTSSGTFLPAFSGLFGLDEAETAKLQEGMTGIRNRVEALIAARSTVTRNIDGSLVIACEPLPEGEVLRRELRDLMLATLDQERFEAFLMLRPTSQASGGGGIDDFFNAFGTNGVIFNVWKQPAGTYRYQRRGAVVGRTTGNTPAAGGGISRDRLLNVLGPQAALLPADF